jgi:sugar O-acyltransferase (sialic acid O-acetyltransferase NeuD family)
MKKTLAVLGASGHGKVVAEVAAAMQYWTDIVFYDDQWPAKQHNGSFAVVGDTRQLIGLAPASVDVFVAIGNNATRLAKQQLLVEHGFKPAILLHPRACIANSVSIGAGTVVMAGAVINAAATIGECCIINSNATVEHDCQLAAAVHISPAAALAGAVQVGARSWIGLNASVIQQVCIGSDVVVGAGAVVLADIAPACTVVGVPARQINRNQV